MGEKIGSQYDRKKQPPQEDTMVKRIDLFMPPKGQYGVLHHFTLKLSEALVRNHVHTRVLQAERTNPKPFLEKIFSDPPDFTLSFNGLLPDDEGRFFCDLINIPHVACLVDSPNQFLMLAKSSKTIITCPDRFSCEFFRGLNCKNVLFMPHAVEKELIGQEDKKKAYDVVMLASCIDFEAIHEKWKSQFSPSLFKVLREAAEITLSDQDISYVQAFVQALDKEVRKPNGIDPREIDYFTLLDELENYVRGKDRVELLKGIKDARVDIFGAGADHWKKYLKDQKNCVVHDSVSFEKAIDIMKKSKILLNSSAWIKNGAHERIFAGIATGALVITNENIYMREHFKSNEDIVFYQHGKWASANEQVNFYLNNPEKRKEVVEKGRKIVEKHHTWDVRAKQLITELKPILSQISKL